MAAPRRTRNEPGTAALTAMEFNVTREQWIDRFVIRMSNLKAGAEPAAFVELARTLWPLRGQLAPEAVAKLSRNLAEWRRPECCRQQ